MTFGYIINHHTINILCLDSNQSPGENNNQPKFDRKRSQFFTIIGSSMPSSPSTDWQTDSHLGIQTHKVLKNSFLYLFLLWHSSDSEKIQSHQQALTRLHLHFVILKINLNLSNEIKIHYSALIQVSSQSSLQNQQGS